MKIKHILIVAFFYILSTNSFGQADDIENNDNNFREQVQFGAKIGTNYSNVYDADGENFRADSKFGLAAGFFLSIPIGTYLGLQPEILFSQKGFKAEGDLLLTSYVLTRTSNYIDIPLLVSIKPVENVSILAGPQYSYLISQNNKFENGLTTIEQELEFDNENLRKNTFCFTGGLDLNLTPMVLSGRVGWDLFKNNGDGTITTPQYKNVWYQVTLGYLF